MNENITQNKDIMATETPQTTGELVWEVVKFTLLAIIIVMPIRFFIAQPFIVSGDSMDPTFLDSQYLIVDEITYRLHPPERGDVVIFKYPKDPSKYFIKRIIGLPGETVTIMSGNISITSPDGKSTVLEEPYLKYRSFDSTMQKLGASEYFAMGDNRSNSLDSRIWGPLPKEDITGRVLVRLFPFNKIGIFPGKETQ